MLRILGLGFLCMMMVACQEQTGAPLSNQAASASVPAADQPQGWLAAPEYPMPSALLVVDEAKAAQRQAYFGDLHVHTDYSFDAFAFGTVATPYDAYRYAKGEAIKHPGGFDVQLRQPLDFYAVTDHAMFLGAVKAAADTSTEFSKFDYVSALHDLNAPENRTVEGVAKRRQAFSTFLPDTLSNIASGDVPLEVMNGIAQAAWADTINAANAFYEPGRFTTFVAYEYTSSTNDRGNLHRNVVFANADRLPVMPFSRFHSQNPEGLWRWMDGLRGQGIDAIAIPHNSNGSNGHMFALSDWAGEPLDAVYADLRLRNEPLIEITQVKGTSETHPMLSGTDEWADFEIMPYRIATLLYSEPKGSYAREALRHGLEQAERGERNPFQFGFVGASDTHTAAISDDESNFFSKIGLLDSTSTLRGSTPIAQDDVDRFRMGNSNNLKEVDGRTYLSGAAETWGAAGVAGVWAEDNTREAIFAAFRRKETFATSGPRIKARLFASSDFGASEPGDALQSAYQAGVAMGSEYDVAARGEPYFLAWATSDALSAKLQRLQIVKAWVDADGSHEKVFDVACSDGQTVDPNSNRCGDNGATVNLSDCSIDQSLGASELKTIWRDPEFNSAERALYYVRVLENPTCRWSTWDAVRAGVAPREDLKKTIQERAWTSPIWVMPDAG